MQEMYAYRCDKCGKLHHPRYAVCQNPECDGRSFTQEPLEGHCKLLTWTRVFNLPEGYMKAWLNFGIVQFDNGVTATGQLGFDERPEIGHGPDFHRGGRQGGRREGLLRLYLPETLRT